MENKYTYLFPFEKIAYSSHILIYGAGDVGQEYMQQILMTNYAEVIGFIDRSYDKYPKMIVPIYPPDSLKKLEFDYVVLAVKTGNVADDIRKMISSFVPEEKIIFQEPRNSTENMIVIGDEESKSVDGLAFEKGPLSIALKLGPQLGDSVIRKRLFVELTRMAPNALIDIYAPNADKFIYSIYNDQPALNAIVNDGGALYARNSKKYALAMSIFYMINIDYINYEKIAQSNREFADKMALHRSRHQAYGLSIYPSTQNRIHIGRTVFRGWNCYSAYNYTGIFRIEDSNVTIPFDETYREQYDALKLKKYITLNFGNGTTSKGNKHSLAKQWPWEYYNQFIEKFKARYPKIEIIQIGDNTTERVIGADRYILGESLELVKYILQGALFHLDIEGGLMHLTSQIGTKCIVIYGPTQPDFFGYKNNINIVSEKCGGCYCLYNDTLRCARDLEKPECMWSITPEMVMERVEEHMESVADESGISKSNI